MTAIPNLSTTTDLAAKTAVMLVTATSASIVGNAETGKVYRVASLHVSNVHATDSHTFTLAISRGGVEYRVVYDLTIPAHTSVALLARDAPLYLEAGDSLRVKADTSGVIEAVSSYEIIA